MNVNTILEQIDEEIARLQQAGALLTDEPTKKAVGRPKKARGVVAAKLKRRGLSAEGKAKIAAVQKARRANAMTSAKKAAPAKS